MDLSGHTALDAASDGIEFPKIMKDFQVSPEVEAMVIGKLPEGFDFGKERDTMWEDFAK